jgi:hypothetical protein
MDGWIDDGLEWAVRGRQRFECLFVIDTLRWRRSETCERCDGCTYVKYSITKVNAVEAWEKGR